MDTERKDIILGRKRVKQIFRYLEELNRRRNPIIRQTKDQSWAFRFADLPADSSVQIGDSLEEPSKIVLSVGRSHLTEAPAPPQQLLDWLQIGWNDPDQTLQIRQTKNLVNATTQAVVVQFDEVPELRELANQWRPIRDAWAENERPARAARRLFEKLYEIYGQMEREAERQELVLGDGVLNWHRKDGNINHPVLLQRLQLQFNAQKPEFIIRETEHPLELYSALFRGMADVDGGVIGKCRAELEEGQFDLIDPGTTTGFLRRFIAHLSAQGEYVEGQVQSSQRDHPQIAHDPVLLLRSRTLGFATALEAIVADLQNRDDLPVSLLNIAGVEPSPIPPILLSENARDTSDISDGDHILLSKPANPEQIEIARRLEIYGCVLVQGPPGTGKTHTIANLIGHLLAQNKSVLVTSHTTKALRVLRDQVVPQLQPLCVSVLDAESGSRQQLEFSVATIVERLSSGNYETLSQRGVLLAEKRQALQKELQRRWEELRLARFDEYRDLVVAGQALSPSEAARKIASEKHESSWIPSPVTLGNPLPLSTAELIDLYRTNVTIDSLDEAELAAELPDVRELFAPSEFLRLVDKRHRLNQEDLKLGAQFWREKDEQDTPELLDEVCKKAVEAVAILRDESGWQISAIEAGRQGQPHRQHWDNLLDTIAELDQEAAVAQEAILRHGPALATAYSPAEQIRILEEIIAYLENGKQITWFALLGHKQWKPFINASRVGNHTPNSLEEFKSLQTLARVEDLRQKLKGRWERQMVPYGCPNLTELDALPEIAAGRYVRLVKQSLNWFTETWAPVEQDFQQIGFDWQALLDQVPINLSPQGDLLRLRETVTEHLPGVFVSRKNALMLKQVGGKIGGLLHYFDKWGGDVTPVMQKARDAVARYDHAAYTEAYDRLTELSRKKPEMLRRETLLERLDRTAPAWTTAIRNRLSPHGSPNPPGDVEAAWMWRQLNDELDRRQQVSLNQLQQEITQIVEQLRQTTTDLVDCRAWAYQLKRTTLSQRQSLMGWLQTIRRIGKGTGIRVPKLLVEARRLMAESRTAVPVWIMPLTRVVESFDFSTARFDVVIIDEASQCDTMGLIAFYLGKQVVVVGDNEQVSPDAVGEKLEEVQHLIDEHLVDIPNAELYDGQQSVYDLAMRSFGGNICLREHFRCVPDIIQFSNRLSYGGRIKPLRDASAVVTKPYVTAYRVEGATSSAKTNEKEALATASLLIAATEQPEYEDATFGVISLVGEEQSRRIEKLLRTHLAPTEYERRRVTCGTPPQFQGDERDVMFLSVVDGPQGGPLSLRTQPLFKKRFNVAASRARNQMWVVHSLNTATDLKHDDLRYQLIKYAEDPHALQRELEAKEELTDSEFERQVLRRLISAGYCVVPQWKVGFYRIDMVVEGRSKRLAVECDGDRYHTVDNLAADMQRQAILERLGWTFVRIRGSEFFRDPDKAMVPVFAKITQLGIMLEERNDSGFMPAHQESYIQDSLRQRVIRRAEELRNEWSPASSLVAATPSMFSVSPDL